jgi:RNA polymerase sigma-70 factor (ECF subfamily)
MNEPSYSELSDDELLRHIAAGSQAAFGELYDRHSKPLYNYVLRLVFDEAAADDLLQEIFVVVWQKSGRFRYDSRVTTWLFSIAHHRAVDWLRHQQVQNRYQRSLAGDSNEIHPTTPGFDDVVHVGLQNEKIWQAMNRLSADHRAVLELAFVYEMSYREIAAVMDCPLGTVKSRMNHAIKALGSHLKIDGYAI